MENVKLPPVEEFISWLLKLESGNQWRALLAAVAAYVGLAPLAMLGLVLDLYERKTLDNQAINMLGFSSVAFAAGCLVIFRAKISGVNIALYWVFASTLIGNGVILAIDGQRYLGLMPFNSQIAVAAVVFATGIFLVLVRKPNAGIGELGIYLCGSAIAGLFAVASAFALLFRGNL